MKKYLRALALVGLLSTSSSLANENDFSLQTEDEQPASTDILGEDSEVYHSREYRRAFWKDKYGVPAAYCGQVYEGKRCSQTYYQCRQGNLIWGCDMNQYGYPSWRLKGDVPAAYCPAGAEHGRRCFNPGFQCIRGEMIVGCDYR